MLPIEVKEAIEEAGYEVPSDFRLIGKRRFWEENKWT